MELHDSRRLTGPNLLLDQPGAQLDVALEPGEDPGPMVAAWKRAARATFNAVGWRAQSLVERAFPNGVSLAISAPIDALHSAVEVNEWAWEQARSELTGESLQRPAADALAQLRLLIAAECDPRLLALQQAARARGVNFCGDDEWTTVGMGAGGRSFATDDLPTPETLDWDGIRDVPSCMVTGTNGKTTTARMVLSIASAAGLTAGSSTTDRIQIGDEVVDAGDWAGPGGARAVMRDQRVELAVLETARGGLLRRGLGVPRVDAAAITNVAEDHLGEMGVHDLASLTEVKFIVRRAAERLVLCADDPEVLRRGSAEPGPVTWYGLDLRGQRLSKDFASLEDGWLVLQSAGQRIPLGPVVDLPACLGGAAVHNVRNALAAAALAHHLGLSPDAIRAGLVAFAGDAQSNPGRLNVFRIGGVTALVDFAHNPHGLRALLEMAASLPHRRLAILLGQAGDRDDTAIAELATATAAAEPHLVVLKTMREHVRGREVGEVPLLLESTLRASGVPSEAIRHSASELDGARTILDWARDGDLLLLLAHAQRDEVLALVQARSSAG